jgi:homopolymeric O-antigen transport system permease protein
MMVFYHVTPTWRLATLPFFILLTALGTSGVSLWLSAVSVKYRDFVHALPFIIQIWLFASPIAYAASVIPQRYREIYSLNPIVGFVEGFRWAVLGRSTLTLPMIGTATVVTLITWLTGAVFFRHVEHSFADVI